ncbi:periplasmic heavy metal sensor [Jannaschia donghaensis]|uniref:Putative integral membrane protein n=1 Tax=Jannaschia donghaensis TaxID=420998 RepID=A0A0M6YH20_9RHOB|nr:periplasmic heavy metal sensor [Jannaschia donghaensis]CTQ48793.1 putative integral membrane protein [Jannaschia donghaensis]
MTQKTAKRGWTGWALFVSVAVNVAVLAAVVGALLTGGPDRSAPGDDRRRGGGPPEIAALARGLDGPDRRALFQALRANGRVANARERMDAARERIVATLQADPFDRADFTAAMEAQRDLQADLAGRGIIVLADIIADLSAEERAGLADRMQATRRPKP